MNKTKSNVIYEIPEGLSKKEIEQAEITILRKRMGNKEGSEVESKEFYKSKEAKEVFSKSGSIWENSR